MAAHPNVERIRDGFEAFNRGDFDAMRPLLAEDIVWHVGGDHPLSGNYRGRDAVLEYCARVLELTGGTLRGEPVEILANDRDGGVFMHITGERDDRKLDVVLAQALSFDESGHWIEYWALADEQNKVDAFWADAE
jgi:uncharacterized protein